MLTADLGGGSVVGFFPRWFPGSISLLSILRNMSNFGEAFSKFENWFLFHYTPSGCGKGTNVPSNEKNHFLPVILRIILTLLTTGFLIGQSWLIICLTSYSSTMCPPPFILSSFGLKISTSIFVGLQAAVAGEIPPVAGQEIYASNGCEFAFASIVTLTSIFIYAVSVGNLITIINSSSESKQDFINSMNSLESFLTRSAVPPRIIAKTRRYYEFLSEREEIEGTEERELLGRLPLHLQREIKTHIYMGAIFKSVRSFQNVSDSFLTALCEYAILEYALSSDILMYQGDVGDAMYIIKGGVVDVVVEGVVVAKLGGGDLIG